MVNKITSSTNDHFAADLRGFGPVSILAILLIIFTGNVFLGNMIVIPVGAMLVLLWRWLSHTPWREIGYVKPKSWIVTIAIGLVFGIVFKIFMKAIVMPLFGADPVNQTYHFLAGNKALLPAATWAMLVAGFAEETVFRGFMFERLKKILGNTRWAKTFIVFFTSVLFGLAHYNNQGLTGVEQATIVGLVYATIFANTGRIWIIMFAHAAFDLTALAMIYWDLETYFAHLFFR